MWISKGPSKKAWTFFVKSNVPKMSNDVPLRKSRQIWIFTRCHGFVRPRLYHVWGLHKWVWCRETSGLQVRVSGRTISVRFHPVLWGLSLTCFPWWTHINSETPFLHRRVFPSKPQFFFFATYTQFLLHLHVFCNLHKFSWLENKNEFEIIRENFIQCLCGFFSKFLPNIFFCDDNLDNSSKMLQEHENRWPGNKVKKIYVCGRFSTWGNTVLLCLVYSNSCSDLRSAEQASEFALGFFLSVYLLSGREKCEAQKKLVARKMQHGGNQNYSAENMDASFVSLLLDMLTTCSETDGVRWPAGECDCSSDICVETGVWESDKHMLCHFD